MKNWMKMVAILAMVSMVACGCSSQTTGNSASETTAAAETEAAETEAADSVETTETEGEDSASDSSDSNALFFSEGLDDAGNLLDHSPADFLELPDYKTMKLSKADIEVTEEQLAEAIEDILAEYAETVQVTDRAVEDGDTINLDYVGTIDGVAFSGGDTQGAGADLKIGSNSYIDDFEQQLIGAMPGDQVTVTVTFPENYGNEDLNGKEAEFACTINYISESQTPELTDEFVAEKLQDTYKADTVEGLKAELIDNYQKNTSTSLIWNWLLENTTFTQEPEELSAAQLDLLVKTQELYAQMYGYTLADYMAAMGTSEEEFRSSYAESAMSTAKQMLITQAIVDAENLSADDAAMDEYFDGEDFSKYDEFYGSGYVRMQVKLYMVADKIMETVTFE